MTVAHTTGDLEELVVEGLDRAHRHLWGHVMGRIEGVEALFGAAVGMMLRTDYLGLADIVNQAHLDFDAYRAGIGHELEALNNLMAARLAHLGDRLERANTCEQCGAPLTTSIVHRARIGDVEHRWHPACCMGRCGSDDAHHPDYTAGPVPARPADVVLTIPEGS